MNIEPEGMLAAQQGAQLGGNPLRQEYRHPRTKADNLDMGHRAQLSQQIVQQRIRERQRIAPTEQNVAHLRMIPQILNLTLKISLTKRLGRITDHSTASTEATVARAMRCHQH